MRRAFGALFTTALLASVGACTSDATSKVGAEVTTTTKPPVVKVQDGRPYATSFRQPTFVDSSRPTGAAGTPEYSATRSLPTDIYLPKSEQPMPLIMFSHGYHGDPSKFSELFTAWAKAGYIVAAPEFPLTSTRGEPYDDVLDYQQQPADISFVLTQLLDGPLSTRIDPDRIAVAGLSLGGATTYGLVFNPCCLDERFRSAAIFDGVRLGFPKPYEKNRIPVLFAHIDTDIAAPYSVVEKAYADSASPKWLLTFHGGVHPEAYEDTPSPHDDTAVATSIDFFDLTVLDDESAQARLMEHGTNGEESTIVSG